MIPGRVNPEMYPLPRSQIHTTSSGAESTITIVSSVIFFSKTILRSFPSLPTVMYAMAPADIPSASMCVTIRTDWDDLRASAAAERSDAILRSSPFEAGMFRHELPVDYVGYPLEVDGIGTVVLGEDLQSVLISVPLPL